ncbi:MAG TPA: hypothetical protein VE863_16010 [Pyrinomonadaceae bacterium]|jgi:hypothetical protein|nr:hypothetical protein [Pyrinomonadaceae bacterium]
MIIQKVIKGIAGIDPLDAQRIMEAGIYCNWWRKVGTLPFPQVPLRLNAQNLDWHQNHYDDPDPNEGGEQFGRHTPFISTTAGSVERDIVRRRNFLLPAQQVGLEFATNGWRQDGCLFYCYVFIIGRPSIAHQVFSEEIRELNIFTTFSLFQPEGEITAKIVIPPAQIERFEFYDILSVRQNIRSGRRPTPSSGGLNARFFEPPDKISNIREFLI